MRQAQVCKLQRCDRCGGRFGMVTHRWWGHKFCKRRCKEAHLREIILGRNAIGRWLGVAAVSNGVQVAGGSAS